MVHKCSFFSPRFFFFSVDRISFCEPFFSFFLFLSPVATGWSSTMISTCFIRMRLKEWKIYYKKKTPIRFALKLCELATGFGMVTSEVLSMESIWKRKSNPFCDLFLTIHLFRLSEVFNVVFHISCSLFLSGCDSLAFDVWNAPI